MIGNEYITAWLWYVFGAAVFFAVFWYLTRKIVWTELRNLMRLVLAVILFVPWYTDDTEQYFSPAWLVSIAETLLDGSGAFWRAGTPLVITLVSAILLYTLYSATRWYLSRKNMSTEQAADA